MEWQGIYKNSFGKEILNTYHTTFSDFSHRSHEIWALRHLNPRKGFTEKVILFNVQLLSSCSLCSRCSWLRRELQADCAETPLAPAQHTAQANQQTVSVSFQNLCDNLHDDKTRSRKESNLVSLSLIFPLLSITFKFVGKGHSAFQG